MQERFRDHLNNELESIRGSGLYKSERVITTPQDAHVRVGGGETVLNLCANNYLGLAEHPAIVQAAKDAIDRWGYGLASVRFICGTQQVHKALEEAVSAFLATGDTILYSSCFDANGGLFETLLSDEDAVISDALNHASIIDGIRLSKAVRYRYRNSDMDDLRTQLELAQKQRFRLIVTDGVFSMDGYIANLPAICDLADEFDALVMVDDSHGVGVLGDHARGTPEFHGVMNRIDIITGTLGKALGGASGGFTSGRREIVELLRQRSRPYLFSNTLAPSIAGGSLKALEILTASTDLRDQLHANTRYFRHCIGEIGLKVLPGEHPIVPIMLEDASLATRMAERLLDEGVYVVGFSFPVVPRGAARIRTQISAAHRRSDLDFALEKFALVKGQLGI